MTANCLSTESCLIFMPRVDLWAIESVHDGQTSEHDTHYYSSEEQCMRKATVQRASSAWAIFMDQVESFSHSTPFIFLVCIKLIHFFFLFSYHYQIS